MAEAYAKDSTIPSIEPKSKSNSISSSPTTLTPHRRNLLMAQDILRLLAIVLSAASIAVMVTNSQTVFLFSLPFEAHFYYSSAFKFLVAANGVVCAFSLLTLTLNFLLRQRVSKRKDYFFFLFTHDIVMTVVLIAGCAAATAIGYVGQFGEEHMGWQPLCDHVRKFCKTNSVSLLLSYLSFLAYFLLTLLTAYKGISFFPKN